MKGAKKDHFYNVVVVGGTTAGVKAALECAKDLRCKVTFVAETDTLQLHRMSAPPFHVSISFAKIFVKQPVTVVEDVVVGIDSSRKIIVAGHGQYQYDVVIFALPATPNYFGIPELKRLSIDVTRPESSLLLQKLLHEEVVQKTHGAKGITIVGAGPAGVELAGMLGEYIQHIAASHGARITRPLLTLIEAAPRVLPRMHPRVARTAREHLEKLGVAVRVGVTAKHADADSLMVSGTLLPLQRAIWSAGHTGHPFFRAHRGLFHLNSRGKVLVNEYLEAAPGVFVIGNNAVAKRSDTLQAGLREACSVASVIRARLSGKTPRAHLPRQFLRHVSIGEHLSISENGRSSRPGIRRRSVDFLLYRRVVPTPIAVNLLLKNPASQHVLCELCQKNNDSSRVAPK